MASLSISTSTSATKFSLQNDRRDVKDLWNDALKDCKATLGRDLQADFRNVDDMIHYGTTQNQVFEKWRHDGKKVDKLRRLFMENVRFIESGAQTLIAAATPAFPPAAAIGTALTFVLSACKGQSADYDMITCFFEDMNNFLQRVTILEGRLPEYKAYQTCLMDVFAAFLAMCAFATKFITKGRLKTWIINSVMGQDADLSSARRRMDKNLMILQSATETAILANTQGLKDGQQELLLTQEELRENQAKQSELAQEQNYLLKSIEQSQMVVQDGVDTLKTDVQATLAMIKQKEGPSTDVADEQVTENANNIRTIILPNTENDARLRILCETRVAGTGEWLFQTETWKSWSSRQNFSLLLLRGPWGIGKSHLAVAAHNYLCKAAEQDPGHFSIVAYFFCDDNMDSLRTLDSFMSSILLQIVEQNSVLRDRFSQIFASKLEAALFDGVSEDVFLQDFMTPSFGKDSDYRLHIIVDSIDKLETGREGVVVNMIRRINELGLQIKLTATIRSASAEAWEPASQIDAISEITRFVIDISRQDVLPDMKELIAYRMRTNDKTYGSLSRVTAKTQLKITDQILEKASTLPYVDFALRYLSGIGREGAILRELEAGLTADTSVLFETILNSCKRWLPQDLHIPMQSLLIWLTYSFDLVDLDQANQLLRFSSQEECIRLEEEIEPIFNRILQIGPTKRLSDEESYPDLERFSEDTASVANTHDEGSLLVSLRDQSMRELLRHANIASWQQEGQRINAGKRVHGLLDMNSSGHRIMFLRCCQILAVQRTDRKDLVHSSDFEKLKQYAVKYCLRHWQSIDCDRHEPPENVEVCEAFYGLLSNRCGFAAVIERSHIFIDDILTRATNMSDRNEFHAFSQTWQRWARALAEIIADPTIKVHESAESKHAETRTYWGSSHENALNPLLEAHVENWLTGLTEVSILWAYRCISMLLEHTPYHDLSKVQIEEEYWRRLVTANENAPQLHPSEIEGHRSNRVKDIYLWRTLYRHPLTSNVHFATAVTLDKFEAFEAAHVEMTLAAKKCSDESQKPRILIALSRTYQRLGVDNHSSTKSYERSPHSKNYQQALHYLDLAIGLIPDKSSPTRISGLIGKMDLLKDNNNVTCGGEIDREILGILHEIRTHSSALIVDGINIFAQELLYHTRDHNRVIDFFVGLTPVQRLSLAIDPDIDGLNKFLLPAAILANRTAELQDPYYEILRNLNIGDRGIIWHGSLIRYLHRAIGDLQLAMDVLRQASTFVFTSSLLIVSDYNFFNATEIVEDYLNLASDIVYLQFRSLYNPDAKVILLQEAEAIPLQPLPRSVQMNTTSMLPYLIVLAQMQRRVGSFQKYQETLQQAFDICWANLHDGIISNDSMTVRCLSKVLTIGPGLSREAEITNSSQLYYTGKISDLEKYSDIYGIEETDMVSDGDTYSTYSHLRRLGVNQFATNEPCCSRPEIGHECGTSEPWKNWEQAMYTCMCCTASFLCQSCYDERMKRNGSGEVTGKIDFCCDGGQYLKAPMEGWRGIRDGVIHIENEDPIEFDTFLEQLRDKWRQAWETFWKG